MDAEKCFLEEFIDCYHSHIALWDLASPAYRMRRKKEAGYRELLAIFQKFKSSATIEDVKRKINSLRCGYRRELKKMKDAECTTDPHQPTLWWFDLMSFIYDVEKPIARNGSMDRSMFDRVNRNSLSNCDDGSESYREDKLFTPMKWSAKTEPTSNESENEMYENEIFDNEVFEMKHTPYHFEMRNRDVRKRDERKRESRHREYRNRDDKFDNLGKIWASKMRSLPRMQSILAEKAINDILFEAEIGQLEEHAVRRKPPPSPIFICTEQD